MSNNKLYIILVILAIFAYKADAFRIPRPNTFSLPWTEEQMQQHNEAHEDLWNLQNGEFNLDIVTTSKTNALNGDFWLIQTGATVRLQYKGNGIVWTISPDGV